MKTTLTRPLETAKRSLKRIGPLRALVRRLRTLRRRLFAPDRPRGSADPSPERGALDDLALTRSEWRDQGATEQLVSRARAMSRNSVAWDTLHPRIWLVFCAVLLEAGDRVEAERMLRTWLAKKPGSLPALSLCLPVARFARDLGLGGRGAERTARVADALEASRDHDVFGALIAKGTIAVVGNGSGPLGQARGAEIDAHDVVIRFNNFPRGYETDYGARTDIWVRGAHRDVADRYVIEHFDLVVWEMDVFRNLLEVPAHADILHRDVLFSPGKVTHIDTAAKHSLWESSGLILPTSGAQILWMIHQRRGSLDGVDVYGFSTVDGSADHGHYFDELGDMGRRHNVDGEGAFLRSLRDGDAPGAPEPGPQLTVFGAAYREYDPAAGKTGGPGGVLATQRVALGDSYRGARLEYLFQGEGKAELRERLRVELAGLSAKVADIVIAGEAVRTDPAVLAARAEGRRLLFVCHELGSAYGALLLGAPYVVVYHQQGSTLQEMRSIGRTPTPHENNAATSLEQLVLDNAVTVYFPSLGARDTYRATARIGEDSSISFADRALYNTVSAVDHDAPAAGEDVAEAVLRRLRLPVKDDQTDVFISVGDFNHDKGMDRVPALLQRHAAMSGRRVVWIAVGAASDQARFCAMEAAQKDWSFTARLVGERMTHDRLLALLDYADYYVMMHRRSIFDLATLEAMRAGKALILSPVGGNPEVDLDGNVLFVDEDTIDDACRVLGSRDRIEWGERNRRVFEQSFSLARFAERYTRMLDELVDAATHDDAADAADGSAA
ncbi:glycosyltransferase family 29 protein [Microbacterium fluvii]|uniref:Glycosyltransferase family 29 protein n=1 Tax=Microbacterium fluvii TaxID=415215 RepID=A0ABW2HD22_9MICO|nr:glycosyltransferase family 29 protein [Microbacterium fluvii]MCU4671433.1 glycosyltransferase family 29 protein [Microbacterium fluvii]